MNFVREPQGVLMARSGVIYTVFDNNAKANGFRYELVVQIWHGTLLTTSLGKVDSTDPAPAATKGQYVIADVPVNQQPVDFFNFGVVGVYNGQKIIYDGVDWFIADRFLLRKFPDANGYASYDISRLLQGYFRDLEYNLPLETSGNLTVNADVEATYWDGSKSNPDPAVPANPSPNVAQFGYNYFTDNINLVTPYLSDGFMTDLPNNLFISRDDGRGYAILFTRNVSTSTALGWRFIADTGLTTDHAFTTPRPPLSSEQTILIMQVGYEYLTVSEQNAIDRYYDVVLYDGSGAVGRTIRYNIQEDCKYTLYKVDWINRYGVWDRLFMYGNTRQAMEVQSQEAMRYLVSDFSNDKWKQGDGQYTVFDKGGRDVWTINTGWLSETYNEAIKQLFLAERVVVDGHSAILQEKQVQYKNTLTDKMINYTLTFKFAFTTINTVG